MTIQSNGSGSGSCSMPRYNMLSIVPANFYYSVSSGRGYGNGWGDGYGHGDGGGVDILYGRSALCDYRLSYLSKPIADMFEKR